MRVEPRDIDVINKIMEGCDGLGIVSTLTGVRLIVIRVTLIPEDVRDYRILSGKI